MNTRGYILSGIALAAWMTVFAFVTLSGGCSSSPVASAQTVEQKAYAVYGTFVITEEQAAQLVQQPSTPASLRQSIAAADALAKPSADALEKAFLDYESAAAALKAGTTTADQVAIAQTNLVTWVNTADSDVQNLVSAVKGWITPAR